MSIRDLRPIPVPQGEREALRWALLAVPPCAALGLAVAGLIVWWKAGRRSG